jgi:hypothetical protein
MRGDSQHDSKQDCLFRFPVAALVIELGALQLSILEGGGAVKTYSELLQLLPVRWSRPHNVKFYGELPSQACLRGDSQRTSKQDCLFKFPVAALVIEPRALQFSILAGAIMCIPAGPNQ